MPSCRDNWDPIYLQAICQPVPLTHPLFHTWCPLGQPQRDSCHHHGTEMASGKSPMPSVLTHTQSLLCPRLLPLRPSPMADHSLLLEISPSFTVTWPTGFQVTILHWPLEVTFLVLSGCSFPSLTSERRKPKRWF